ncbi:hypothetical protein [Bacillus sp. FJAT-29814]|uniref:hypothetical protein n=1 Tax=Bacillus sp. FJAT-29814 TaxID=1729688 RepID=UPI00082BE2E6|nr:hypothetical protein [Bacillus sp. FJAT-29814]
MGNITLDGLDEKNTAEFQQVLSRFIHSYQQKDKNVSDQEWLRTAYKRGLPELSDQEASSLSEETIRGVETFDSNLKSLNETIENGGTKESWFFKKVQEASVGVSVNDMGNYLNTIDASIQQANAQMLQAVTNMDGAVSQNMNLDGFMAEQHHVNSFNMNAKLSGSEFIAKVSGPEPGAGYGKNSFDIVILDKNKNIVNQYQAKYGATAQDTIRMVKNGNYNNQRILVPAEQLSEVRKAFPGKTVVSSIGGTDKVKAISHPLEKGKIKELQLTLQEKGILPKYDWNHYQIKDLSFNLAKNAGTAGIQAAVITTGFDLARKAAVGETINVDESIELALKTGTDAGIKAAAAAALKTASEKGILTVIPQGTPAGIIANIACVGIENVKILGEIASGELTVNQGLDRMGRTTTSMAYGLGWAAEGATVGAAVLSWIPVVGPFVGSVVGGTVGYMAGSKFGDRVYNTAKKVSNTAKTIATKTWEGVKSVGRSIANFLFG